MYTSTYNTVSLIAAVHHQAGGVISNRISIFSHRISNSIALNIINMDQMKRNSQNDRKKPFFVMANNAMSAGIEYIFTKLILWCKNVEQTSVIN